MPGWSPSSFSARVSLVCPTPTVSSPMTGRLRLSATYRSSDGFALIIVLWTLVLIAFIVAHVTANGRTEVRIAGNMVAEATAEAADDGALVAGIFTLLDPNPDQRWPLDGSPHELTIGGSRVLVQLRDESERINPSSAAPQRLEALLRLTGSDAESARRLAASISEWVGSDPAGRPQEAQLAEYQAAGLDSGPPNAPLETVDELGRVLGMTPAVLAAVRPHLTLFGPPEPNALSADPIVAAALSQIRQVAPIAAPASQGPDAPLIVRMIASALGPSNARVQRSA